jgi:hypothetical protein
MSKKPAFVDSEMKETPAKLKGGAKKGMPFGKQSAPKVSAMGKGSFVAAKQFPAKKKK